MTELEQVFGWNVQWKRPFGGSGITEIVILTLATPPPPTYPSIAIST